MRPESLTNQESIVQKYCSDIVSECLNEILALKQLSDSNLEVRSVDSKNIIDQKLEPNDEKCDNISSDELALEKFCTKLVEESFQDAMKNIENQELTSQLK